MPHTVSSYRHVRYFVPLSFCLGTAALLLVWHTFLAKESHWVIYFGEPKDILAFLSNHSTALLASSLQTLSVAVGSLLLATTLTIVLLYIGLLSDLFLDFIEQAVAILQTIPTLVIVAVSLLIQRQLLSFADASLSAVWYCFAPVTIALIFPPLANAVSAARRTPIQIKSLMRLWQAPRSWRVLHIYLPWTIPELMTGLRASATWAVGATLIAEGLLNGIDGDTATLGHALIRPFSSAALPGRTPTVIIVSIILGYCVYHIIAALQQYTEHKLRGVAASAEISYPLQESAREHKTNR